MFQLDPRTVLFVNFIYSFCVFTFIISAAFIKSYRFPGLFSWIIAFSLISLNFLLISLRDIIPDEIVYIFPHLLTVWGYIEIKRGLAHFFKIKNRIYTDFLIITVFALALIINMSNARLRILTVCIASIMVNLDIIVLLSSKKAKPKVNSTVIPSMFGLAILVTTARLIMGLFWDPQGNPLETGNSLSVISILNFISNLVVFMALYFSVFKRMLSERDMLIEKMNSISLTDELTGLMNRRGFQRVINYEKRRISRTRKGLTLVICDIDYFKSVNDTYGHDCGDAVLIILGELLIEILREGDTVARWGGEEFVLLLPETDREQAEIVLERMRATIEEFSFEYDLKYFNLTMSFGACCCIGSEIDFDVLLAKADENLYSAKEKGRNRIVMSRLE